MVGSFRHDTVNWLAHGIVPLNVDGQVSEFGYLPTYIVDDEATSFLLQMMDYDSSWHEACLANVKSSSIRCPKINIDCNDKND
jgi:hypothetical protein